MKETRFGIISLYLITGFIFICLFCMGEQLKCNRNEIIELQKNTCRKEDQGELIDRFLEASELIVDIIEQYHPK